MLSSVQPFVKTQRTTTNEYTAKITEDCLYESILKVNPTACIFTIIPEPVTSPASIIPPLSIMNSTEQSTTQIPDQGEDTAAQITEEATEMIDVATAQVTDGATTQLTDNTSTQLTDDSTIQVKDSATTQVRDNATTQLIDDSTIQVKDNSTTQLTDNSTTQIRDNAIIQLTDDATTQVIEDSTTQLTDNVTTQVRDIATTNIKEDTTTQITNYTTAQTTDQPDSSTIQSITRSSTVTNLLPSKLIMDYFDSQYQKLDRTTLLARAKQIFLSMRASDCECRLVEQSTKQQRECDDWFIYRKGRITASSFHDVYVLKAQTDPKNLINKLLLSPNLSRIPEIKWGIDHEDVARQQYVAIMNESHCNFKCHSSGLNINSHYPHLGASPDALIECTCCVGKGIVEIKCPFTGREYHPDHLNKLKNSFLDANGLLNRSHRYFTQVQGQLMITRRDYCDFVVWTPLGVYVQRIYEEISFTEKLVRKLTNFYVEHLLPAIMTGNVSVRSQETQDEKFTQADDQIYCYCHCEEHGKMIECDNKECKIGWFHFTCVGIKRAPRGQWFCPDCKQ